MISRRSLLRAVPLLIAAPAIVRVSSLMRLSVQRVIDEPRLIELLPVSEAQQILNRAIREWHKALAEQWAVFGAYGSVAIRFTAEAPFGQVVRIHLP